MSDQDVFNTENKSADQQEENKQVAPNESVDPWADKLKTITREDGTPKYKSVEEALEALAESQKFISTLKGENSELRSREEELSRKAAEAEALEEVVRRLKEGEQVKPKENTTPEGGLNDDATVEKKLEELLNRKQQEAQALNNLKQVNDELLNKFGEKAPDVVKAKAQELGMTTEELKSLAAKSPKLVLGHFGSTPSKTPANTSSVNTVGLKPKDETVKQPEHSLLSGRGATDRARAEYMRQIREDVYKKHGISE